MQSFGQARAIRALKTQPPLSLSHRLPSMESLPIAHPGSCGVTSDVIDWSGAGWMSSQIPTLPPSPSPPLTLFLSHTHILLNLIDWSGEDWVSSQIPILTLTHLHSFNDQSIPQDCGYVGPWQELIGQERSGRIDRIHLSLSVSLSVSHSLLRG